MKLGARLAHMLAERGFDTAFGIPGVHNQELYRDLSGAGIRHVLARHEQGAGFMADGWARATGQPGLCLLISGPGLLNAATAVGQAWSDSVPMLVVAAALDGARGGRLHEMRNQAGGAAAFAYSHAARDAGEAYAAVDRALAQMACGRPRPHVVNVSLEALGRDAPPPPDAPRLSPRPCVPSGAVDEVARRLGEARRPLVILGGGARRGPGQVVVQLSGAASFTSYAGRGQLSGPLHMGATLARPGSAEMIGRADLVLVVGAELSEPDIWRDGLGHRSDMIRVDLDPAVLADPHGAQMPLLGDAGMFLSDLSEVMGPSESDWTEAEIARFNAAARAETDAERPGIVPICDALREALPKDTAIYSDMTQFAYAAKEVWPMAAPSLWHHPNGFGTLGYALPAAIGGAMARDGRTACIIGDYGLQYTLPELATLRDLELPMPVLVWDNRGLGEITASMERAQIEPSSTFATGPDLRLIAEAYGLGYEEPGSFDALSEAVRSGLRRPTVIRMTPKLTG